jgi:hypothetical protein
MGCIFTPIRPAQALRLTHSLYFDDIANKHGWMLNEREHMFIHGYVRAYIAVNADDS